MADSTRFFCDPCLERYYNEPRKKRTLARCHGCDEIVECSELATDSLKPKAEDNLFMEMFGGLPI